MFSLQGTLFILAAVQACAYGTIAMLSRCFAPGTQPSDRPILQVLAIFAIAFLGYWISLRLVLKLRQSTGLVTGILLVSLLFRALIFVSWPIQEIDIYRYIWDGNVLAQGISPYRYSPQQVLSADLQDALPQDLRRLKELELSCPPLHTILSRVHYGELTTIYPPTSQAVFAAAALLTPDRASVFGHILAMKAAFVMFDLATLLVIVALLRASGKHIGWAVAYGWCPLIIKEIANTGHLDSLAVFLAILALYLALRPLANTRPKHFNSRWMFFSAVAGALAVGAKIYPVILVPLLAAVWYRFSGWRRTLVALTLFSAATAALLWTMMPREAAVVLSRSDTSPVNVGSRLFPSAEQPASFEEPARSGLTAFFRHWEMNDLLFMVVVENLTPRQHLEGAPRAWFAVLPEPWKKNLTAPVSRWLRIDTSEAAFLSVRLVTTLIFLTITAALLSRVRRSDEHAKWLRTAFLIVAWFWLLSPTQNPWYWSWALPLVMFARSRAWLGVGGLAMLYYLRFWLSYHWPDQAVFGTVYRGAEFFDYAVTWIEHGTFLTWLAWDTIHCRTATSEEFTPLGKPFFRHADDGRQ